MYKGYEFHPGHWALPHSGAVGLINEVTEARRVTKRVHEILLSWDVDSEYYEDNISYNQRDNVNHLVAHHNKDKDDFIVSIHFNAAPKATDGPVGTEVLYSTQEAVAAKVSKAIADASGLKDRGAKKRTDLGVLARTHEPAILIEVCFVNSKKDVEIYNSKFEAICKAIAKALADNLGKLKPEVKPVEQQEFLNATGRAACKQIIRHAVEVKEFDASHTAKLDTYPDKDLISYALTYVERRLLK